MALKQRVKNITSFVYFDAGIFGGNYPFEAGKYPYLNTKYEEKGRQLTYRNFDATITNAWLISVCDIEIVHIAYKTSRF